MPACSIGEQEAARGPTFDDREDLRVDGQGDDFIAFFAHFCANDAPFDVDVASMEPHDIRGPEPCIIHDREVIPSPFSGVFDDPLDGLRAEMPGRELFLFRDLELPRYVLFDIPPLYCQSIELPEGRNLQSDSVLLIVLRPEKVLVLGGFDSAYVALAELLLQMLEDMPLAFHRRLRLRDPGVIEVLFDHLGEGDFAVLDDVEAQISFVGVVSCDDDFRP